MWAGYIESTSKSPVVIYMNCAVPGKIHTHPMEGHSKFLGRGGGGEVYKNAKILEAKYISWWGGGGQNSNTYMGAI